MKPALNGAVVAAGCLLAGATASADMRNQIRVVGSSTVFPYTQAVAEQYAAATGGPSPIVESTGTGGGIRIFCSGIGLDTPDIVGASRPMKESEYRLCQTNGVTSITEALIGKDGLSLAQSLDGPDIALTNTQLFQALAAEVPVDGAMVANPYARWNEIDAALPDMPIRVFGPPPTSGSRDSFVETVMDKGCAHFAPIAAMPDSQRRVVCSRMRQDGPYVEAGENDNLIVQRLRTDPEAIGIFGYSFLFENQDTLRGIPVDGLAPTLETIANNQYELSRPLYLYIKNAHRPVVLGMEAFLSEYVSEDAFGPEGYLAARGLVFLPEDERASVRASVETEQPMTHFP